MIQITIINGNIIKNRNCFNEPNPYRLIMDLVKQANWPLDMVSFTRFKNGLSAVLDATDKKEIVVQY
jgi:hypothetical protein